MIIRNWIYIPTIAQSKTVR